MALIKEIHAKSILNKSQIFDYCVNPYNGCQVNCRYCYASLFMRRYSGHKEPWGGVRGREDQRPGGSEKTTPARKKRHGLDFIGLLNILGRVSHQRNYFTPPGSCARMYSPARPATP